MSYEEYIQKSKDSYAGKSLQDGQYQGVISNAKFKITDKGNHILELTISADGVQYEKSWFMDKPDVIKWIGQILMHAIGDATGLGKSPIPNMTPEFNILVEGLTGMMINFQLQTAISQKDGKSYQNFIPIFTQTIENKGPRYDSNKQSDVPY
jgi:hypothetical protein